MQGTSEAASTNLQDELSKSSNGNIARVALVDRLDTELRVHQTLMDAVMKVRKVGQEFLTRTKELEAKLEMKKVRRNKKKSAISVDLWQPDYSDPVNFEVCAPFFPF